MDTLVLPPLHPQESERLKTLESLGILDTPAEASYDELVRLAAEICEAPIAVVSLIDRNRQWFKAKVGLEAPETPREVAFCAYCILGESVMEVSDATQDIRFKDNPLVTGEPHIRFYAGAPLFTSNGLALGSLCVISAEPRKLSSFQKNALMILGRQVSHLLELRQSNLLLEQRTRELTERKQNLEHLFRIISHDLRTPFQGFLGITELLEESIKNSDMESTDAYLSMLNLSTIETHNLLENLLEWSTLEVGALSVNWKHIYLKKLIQRSVLVLTSVIRKKHIELAIDIADDIKVRADPKMVGSVIRNLMSNAIKFTPENGRIEISGGVIKGRMKITISDNGVGLSEEQIENILEQKNIVSSAGTKGEYGSGIGLHLVHLFLKRHNTKLSVIPRPDGGTAFSFSLRLSKV